MWLLLGYLSNILEYPSNILEYPSNILGYPRKYWNYNSKKQFAWFPHFPRSPWINFLPFISQFFLLNIKNEDFDFRMGCILVLFLFLWIINVQFTNLGFFIFKYSDIGLLWSKITIFIIEITLKRLLHKKYGWNKPNWGRLGLKCRKLHFFAISGSSKSSHTQTFKYTSCAQFSS